MPIAHHADSLKCEPFYAHTPKLWGFLFSLQLSTCRPLKPIEKEHSTKIYGTLLFPCISRVSAILAKIASHVNPHNSA